MGIPDVVVVGGGVIGSSIAWRSATAGLDVTIVEQSYGRGSSWAAAGMLAPVTESHFGEERVLRLGIESLRRYPDFVAELESVTGVDVGFAPSGTVVVARDSDDFEALSDLFRFQKELELDVKQLSRRETRALEPALHPGLRAAWFAAGDHHVDNRALADSLHRACVLSGVEVVEAVATEILVSQNRATGLRLESGETISCNAVVLAAGCWSGAIAGIPDGARPPVRPVKGQLLYLRDRSGEPLVGRNIRGRDVYLVPRGDGRIVVGATVEEQGYDTTITAGAIFELLRAAYELVPGIVELELSECVAGLRPGSPDNAPMIGETSVAGLVVATGHYRNGILMTPLTAESITQLLTTGVSPEIIAPASPRRFESMAALR